MSGSRYTIEVDVKGNAEAKLDGIAAGVGKVAAQGEALSSSMKGAGASLADVEGGMASLVGMQVAEKLEGLADKFQHFAASVMDGAADMTKEIIKDASEFEDMQSALQFGFHENWGNVYDQVLKDSAKLSFTFKEVGDLAAQLGRMNINPFGGLDAESQKFKGKMGEDVRALEILQDTSAATGADTSMIMRGIHGVMADMFKELKMGWKLNHEQIEKVKHAIKGLHDPQAKYNALIKELGQMFGGANKMKENNYSLAVIQIGDLLQQLRAKVGMENLHLVSQAINRFTAALKEFVGVGRGLTPAMQALADGFKLIQQGLVLVIDAVTWLVKFSNQLLTMFPWLPKLVLGFVAVATAAASFASIALSLTASLILLGTTPLPLIIGGIGMLLGVALVLLPVLVTMATMIGVLGLAAKSAAELTGDSWSGVGQVFDKINAIFTAIGEAFDTYADGSATFTLDTANRLKALGLWDFAVKIVQAVDLVVTEWEAFKEGIDAITDQVGPDFLDMMNQFYDLADEVAQAFGLLTDETDDSENSFSGLAGTGRVVAQVLGWMVGVVFDIIGVMAAMAKYVMAAWNAFDGVFHIVDGVKLLVGALREMLDIARQIPGLGSIFGEGGARVEKTGFRASKTDKGGPDAAANLANWQKGEDEGDLDFLAKQLKMRKFGGEAGGGMETGLASTDRKKRGPGEFRSNDYDAMYNASAGFTQKGSLRDAEAGGVAQAGPHEALGPATNATAENTTQMAATLRALLAHAQAKGETQVSVQIDGHEVALAIKALEEHK